MKQILSALILSAFICFQAFAQALTQEMVDAVSADSLMATIKALESFGTRYEYTPQQDSAGVYLLREFSRLGLQAEADPYVVGTVTLYDIAASSNGTLFMPGSSGALIASTNGGERWTTITTPAYSSLYGIAFANQQNGCVVGSAGTILRTSDGGSTWTAVTSGVANTLYGISFADATVGVTVGSGGKILRTTDAGTHWTSVTSGTAAHLRAVKVLNSVEIWVGGDAGTLLHSKDAGRTWLPVTTGLFNALYAIEFSTPSHGWAVGSGPVVIATTNGGISWNQIPAPPTADRTLRGICFQDSLHGWMVEYYGKFFATTDGGNSWSTVYDHMSGDWGPFFFGIKPLRGQQVLAYGSQGSLLSSMDDGQHWTSQTANLPSSLLHATYNIVATLPGKATPERECVLVAHYDSYCANNNPNTTAPGANDNASGTSAILEAARIARGYQFQSTLRFVAVSGEELGMYGSNHYARECVEQQRNIIGVVNGDMIGYPTTPDTARLAIATYLTANSLLDSALAANQRYGLGITLTAGLDSTGASDYGPFAIRGYDALDIAEGTPAEIWGGHDPYYHSSADTTENIHAGLVRRGAQLMLAVAANLAGPLGTDGVQEQRLETPERFALEQNFPNPFNPVTTIKYTVGGARVKLAIYDLLGREVAVLVNEKQQPGVYQVRFDGGRLASGVYVYRLITGSSVRSRTMLLLK